VVISEEDIKTTYVENIDLGFISYKFIITLD